MTRTVLLNNEDHQYLKIDTRHNAQLAVEYGDKVNTCLTFMGEFRTMQAHYPLFFQKDGTTGQFHPIALLGFAQGENLFLNEENWDCPYIPALIARHPFSIGRQSDAEGQQERRVVHVDLDHPRVNDNHGEALFLEFGGSSPYLQNIAELLETIHLGLEQNKLFVEALLEHDLLESFSLDVELKDGSRNQLIGYYTINEEKLFKLTPEQIQPLNEHGFLMGIYMMLASQSQLSSLIARKNATLAQG